MTNLSCNHTVAGLLVVAALQTAVPAFGANPPTAPVAASQPGPAASVARAEAPFSPVAVYRDQLLSQDAVWRGPVLIEGVLTVAPQATLTVEPGTVVRFRRAGAQAPLLVVQGRIVATGTRETPILFTSSFSEPSPSDWQGVLLLGSEKKNVMENCRIEGAEVGLEALFSNLTLKGVRADRSVTGMRFQDALLDMEGGGAFDCGTGLSFSEAEATLRGVAVEGNRIGLHARRSSVYLSDSALSGNQEAAFTGESCRFKIEGTTVVGNGSGVTAMESEGGVVDSRIVKNREHGISLTGSRIRVNGNHVSGNGGNGMIVFDASSAAWGNAIHDNAGYDLYNAGTETFRAPGNWWGGTAPRIFDNAGRGKVLSAPLLGEKPRQD